MEETPSSCQPWVLPGFWEVSSLNTSPLSPALPFSSLCFLSSGLRDCIFSVPCMESEVFLSTCQELCVPYGLAVTWNAWSPPSPIIPHWTSNLWMFFGFCKVFYRSSELSSYMSQPCRNQIRMVDRLPSSLSYFKEDGYYKGDRKLPKSLDVSIFCWGRSRIPIFWMGAENSYRYKSVTLFSENSWFKEASRKMQRWIQRMAGSD